TASDPHGQVHNVNADTAAAKVAVALKARRLVYLSDVPGLLRDPNDPSSLLSSLPVDQVDPLKKEGVISRGMLPKVESAVEALGSGVNRVHFIDGRVPHSILLEIFTDRGIGTEIVHE
ncbi:MAG: acetylglutamate kinase, partial [Opitutae bacterium]|nr:acetylglutamate kinase [Opitutae bacterium]